MAYSDDEQGDRHVREAGTTDGHASDVDNDDNVDDVDKHRLPDIVTEHIQADAHSFFVSRSLDALAPADNADNAHDVVSAICILIYACDQDMDDDTTRADSVIDADTARTAWRKAETQAQPMLAALVQSLRHVLHPQKANRLE